MSKSQPEDEPEFANLFPGIKRLRNDRVNTYAQRPEKNPVLRRRPESDHREYAALNLHQRSDISEHYYHSGIPRKLQRKIRQGTLPIDDSLDLHGCTQKTALIELAQFFDQAIKTGCLFLVIIHGKGNRSNQAAVLKPLVHHWLSQHANVLAWCPAQVKDGGSGASYVYLKSITR